MNYKTIAQINASKVISPLYLYDRVINIMFTVWNNESQTFDQYVLRSDYELDSDYLKPYSVYMNDQKRKYVIRKCTYKPSVRIKFSPIGNSGNEGVDIDLWIDNFYMISPQGKIIKNLVGENVTIKTITVALGYFNQFTRPTNLEQFFTINEKSGNGITIINYTFNWAKVDGKTPNETTHLYGVYGQIINSPVQVVVKNEEVFEKLTFDAFNSDSKASDVLTKYITYRFIDESSFATNSAEDLAEYKAYTEFMEQKNNTNLLKNPAYISIMQKHGIKILMTKAVEDLQVRTKTIKKDGSEQEVKIVMPWKGATVSNTVRKLNRWFAWDLKVKCLDNGKVVIYRSREQEDIDELSKELNKRTEYSSDVFNKVFNRELPAVYTISKDSGHVTISCPFFAFIKPLEECKFSTDYGNYGFATSILQTVNITSMNVISQSVDFATVDDINEVVLQGTERK